MPTKNCPKCGHPIYTVPLNAESAYCGYCHTERKFPRVKCPKDHDRGNKVFAGSRIVNGRRVHIYEDCVTCRGTGMVWETED